MGITMSTPLELIRSSYESAGLNFPQDLCLHLRHGWVIVSPSLFLMGRPVRRSAPYDLLNDISHTFTDPDAWLVWAAAGAPPCHLIRHMPHKLPYVGWARHGRIRWYLTSKLNGRTQAKAGHCADPGRTGDCERCSGRRICTCDTQAAVLGPCSCGATSSCGGRETCGQ
jgi:hypothetical protein